MKVKIENLYQKENNLFQSDEWLSFQKSYGREVVRFAGGLFGISYPLYFGKTFIWIQKSPVRVKDAEKIKKEAGDAVFIRIEPSEIRGDEVAGLKKVGSSSLLSGQKSPKATQLLDISESEDDILAGMKSKTRYNIRLAEKKGVVVRSSTEPGDVEVFYGLLTKTSQRNKGEYMPHPKDYYEKMMEELGSKGLVKIYFAEYEGKAIAGIMVSRYGEVSTYLHGGFSDENKEVMAPYLCHWKAILEAKKAGVSIYDFWGVAETDEKSDPWAGITRFKKGFGGETSIFPGTFDLVLNPFWYNIFSVAAKLRKIGRR